MAVTENTYTGNGSTDTYSFTFPYLDAADIKVSLNGTPTTAYTLATATTIQFNTAPANGVAIRIYRVTDDAALNATFISGSAIRAQDLNNNFTQNLYVTQESGRDATKAITTAESAVTTANSAVTTANTAVSTANSAVTTANSALSTANSAVTTANSAVSTANTAVSTANSAVTTANTASANASAALTAAAEALAYTVIADVAAIPVAPANGDAVRILDSTGVESFTPLSSIPVGFTGDPGLTVEIYYDSGTSSWVWVRYYATDPELRYIAKAGDTMTGALVLNADPTANLGAATKQYVDTAVGNVATDAISEGNTSAEVVDTGSDGRFVVNTDGVEALRVDNQQRVGIGTASPLEKLHVSGGPVLVAGELQGVRASSTALDYSSSQTRLIAMGPDASTTAPILFLNGTSSAVTEKVRIDSSGRLLVGTSSARGASVIQTSGNEALRLMHNVASADEPILRFTKTRAAGSGDYTAVQSGDYLGTIYFQGADGSADRNAAAISAIVDGTPGANDMPGRLVFSVTADGASSPTERMRIGQSGLNRIYSSAAVTHVAQSWSAAGTTNSLYYGSYGATDNQGTSAVNSYVVWSNGNVQNTNNSYTGISDIKLKENIVDASSQWDDIKALRPVNYNFKEGQTHTQIGLIAQEVELVSPGLVSESPDRDAEGNDLGTVTKSVNYSVLYMKAVKALQEAMERIEVLEQRLTDAGIA